MRFREVKQEELSVDLTPFIDVVFVLLLFFVVSTTFFKEATKLDVELPEANAKARASDKKSVEIGVDIKGEYFLNGQPLGNDVKRLKLALNRIVKEEECALVVVGDKAAPYQSVIYALEVAGECGIKQVQIIAQKSA